MVVDTQQSSAHAAHFTSAVYTHGSSSENDSTQHSRPLNRSLLALTKKGHLNNLESQRNLEKKSKPLHRNGRLTTLSKLSFTIWLPRIGSPIGMLRVTARCLWDDNNRRPVCRFYFNGRQKRLGLFDGSRADSGALNVSQYDIESLETGPAESPDLEMELRQ